jgi:DNA polymerase family A
LENGLSVLVTQTSTSIGGETLSGGRLAADLALPTHLFSTLKSQPRYFVRRAFNPSSSKQVIGAIKALGQQPGRNRKSQAESGDRKALERLAAKTKDPFFLTMIEQRAVSKLMGTYVGGQDEDGNFTSGLLGRLDPESRFHTDFTHNPSTMRLSATLMQNMAGDDDEEDCTDTEEGLCKHWRLRFRRQIEAAPGCKLIYADFGGIEAVETGWFSQDKDYIRLATIGVHDYVTSAQVGKKADLRWSDTDLRGYLQEIKKQYPHQRKICKRVVHRTNYCSSPRAMHLDDPELFPSTKVAEDLQNLYFECCPRLKPWWGEVRERAYSKGYLGGPLKHHSQASGDWYRELIQSGAHPFGYKHWFWHIKDFKKVTKAQAMQARAKGKPVAELGAGWYVISWGDDAKRAVAFYPQSTAAGVIAEAILRLFTPGEEHFIGDAYYGQTPLRAQVHDALLLEVPDEQEERVLRALAGAMACRVREQPCPPEWGLGDYLRIGVEVKVGRNWSEKGMTKVKLEGAA